VVFAGGFGLPLLMQPHSIAEATTSADRIFIVPPRCSIDNQILRALGGWPGGAQGAWPHEPIASAGVVDVLQVSQYRFGMAIYPSATMLFGGMSG